MDAEQLRWETVDKEMMEKIRREEVAEKEHKEEEKKEEREKKLECPRRAKAAMEENLDALRKGKWHRCTQ